ncbi:FtsB family cell division protein [Ligaoa zhengdingensis]|nr:septum formation initiator family protein [Ligaoa zhengdingensis]
MRGAKKEKRNDKARLLKFAVCVFVVYVVYMLVQQQFDIKSREQELIAVQQQVEDKRLENKEIERLLESDNEQYVERLAKDEYGYAYPDETVYIDTSGN